MAATPPEDPDIEAYRARLKQRTPIRFSPNVAIVFAAVLAGLGTVAYMAWKEEAKLAPPPPAAPAPPTPADLAKKALQSVADTYAPTEAGSLEEASVVLARGRKVCFVKQSMNFDPEIARVLGHATRSRTAVVMLPEGFDPGVPGALAVEPKDVGVVVLVSVTMRQVGTYTGGKEPALDIEYDAVAILVPEAKRVARFTHLSAAPPSATRYGTGKDSVLVGNLTHDDGSWMRDAATALADGRAPSR